MTTTISDAQGKKRSEGKNLAVMLRYAKRCGGVKSIAVGALWPSGTAHVTATYTNGWTATTGFSCYHHACEWAASRSKLGRNSWFSGCEVILKG
jgi:hypothetical protein